MHSELTFINFFFVGLPDIKEEEESSVEIPPDSHFVPDSPSAPGHDSHLAPEFLMIFETESSSSEEDVKRSPKSGGVYAARGLAKLSQEFSEESKLKSTASWVNNQPLKRVLVDRWAKEQAEADFHMKELNEAREQARLLEEYVPLEGTSVISVYSQHSELSHLTHCDSGETMNYSDGHQVVPDSTDSLEENEEFEEFRKRLEKPTLLSSWGENKQNEDTQNSIPSPVFDVNPAPLDIEEESQPFIPDPPPSPEAPRSMAQDLEETIPFAEADSSFTTISAAPVFPDVSFEDLPDTPPPPPSEPLW